MKIKWRKINRVLHRDLGYFFTGMIIVYALSGIALNHLEDWNPNYVVNLETKQLTISEDFNKADKKEIISLVNKIGVSAEYKNHYFPEEGKLKVFLQKGSSIVVDLQSGEATIETIRKRPVFYQVNFLHYNPGKAYKWFADIFAIALIILAVSGLFILKGKNGIKRRGTILAGFGIIITIVFLIIYLN
ncbi:PepSY-associated TM helix domain-containing protein [Marinilabilia rubra]|uniref:Peptidase n=1 Tax=Marinilabilia rubra TaxID=2162893 RepID=A0A2U2B6H4_9BACT|nr:PepSY-associated TM helix domain-containing protein [Marinilabilia rubra]PWD98680.1 hypothetical protein DDZ16_14565 [Marinilabilia rubra]